jgi:NADPH:quinone reductase
MSFERMQAAVLVAPGRFEVEALPLPPPGPNEVRIRLDGCGVCASNIPAFEGRAWFEYPFAPGALGHEGWGVVDALGRSVRGIQPGDRVVALSYKAFATHDVAPASHVVALPRELGDRPLPGEPLGCAMNVFARSGIGRGRPEQVVAVVGVGFLGVLLVQLARHAGARVIALSRRPCARAAALAAGADHVLDLSDAEAALAEVVSLTDGALCDCVIEATGKPGPLDLAGQLTRVRGRLVIAGYHQDGRREVDLQLWNWRGLDVVNAHERDPAQYVQGIRAAIAAVLEGRLTPYTSFTHSFGLEALDEALRMARDRPEGFMKALVAMSA